MPRWLKYARHASEANTRHCESCILAYAIASAKAAWHAHGHKSDYHITLDGREVHCPGITCVIVNHGAGLLHLQPAVMPTDGLLDVMVFSDEGMRTAASTLANVLLDAEKLVPVQHWQARDVMVFSDPPQSIQADGEVLPAGQVRARAVPGAVNFIVPAASARK